MIDLLSFILSYYPAYFLAFSSFFREKDVYGTIQFSRYVQFMMIVVVAYVITNVLTLYTDDQYLNRGFGEEVVAVIKLTFYVISLILILFFALKTSFYYSRMFIGIFSIVFVVIDVALRMAVKRILLPKYKESDSAEKIVVISDSHQAEDILKHLISSNDWRYRVTGIVLVDQTDEGKGDSGEKELCGIPVVGRDLESAREFIEFRTSSVFYALTDIPAKEKEAHLEMFSAMGKTIHLHLEDVTLSVSTKKLDTLGGLSVMTFLPGAPMARRTMIFKGVTDLILCLATLPVFAAVTVLTAFLNLLFSRGPLFTEHVRIGQSGGRFYLYRFRTMYVNAHEREAEGQSVITPAGRILRFFHMDGMPQWINVFSREMGFVGPKPALLKDYLSMNKEERSQYTAKPGVTGNWAIDEYNRNNDFENERGLVGYAAILLTAVFRFITFRSNRSKWYHEYEAEERIQCRELFAERIPLAYAKTGYQPRGGFLYRFLKRTADIVLSAAGIFVLIPVYLIIAIAIIGTDGGTPFYAHSRIGKHGQRIRIFKFRSMREDAGDLTRLLTPEQLEQYRKEFKINNDPRITEIGLLLRRTSLDELPQLFNVLGGSLSLIGPRPVVEDEISNYGPDTEKFLSVKPGMTGYWQAYARNEAGYGDGKRQSMELYYVEHRSLWFDLRIFFKTFGSVFSGKGAL